MRARRLAAVAVALACAGLPAGSHAAQDVAAVSDTITFGMTIDLAPAYTHAPGSTGSMTGTTSSCTLTSDPGDPTESGSCGGSLSGAAYLAVAPPAVTVTGTATFNTPEGSVTVGLSAVTTDLLNWVIADTVRNDVSADPDTGGPVTGTVSCTVATPAQLNCNGTLTIFEGPLS